MKENSAQKSTQAANLATVDLPPNPATNPLNTLRPPHWPPVPSPAVCLFIFYVRVGVQVCLRERRSSALNGPLLLRPVGSVGASHHIAVYVACVFACLDFTFTHCSSASGDVLSRRCVFGCVARMPGPGRTGSTVPNL